MSHGHNANRFGWRGGWFSDRAAGALVQRRWVPSRLGLFIGLLVMAGSCGMAWSHMICVYVQSPSVGSPSGHAFIQLVPSSGPQANNPNLVYGFSPQKGVFGALGGNGSISSNATHAWDWQICYTVTAAQYNSAAAAIRGDITAPPNYNLLDNNCVDWAGKIAGAAGISLPSYAWFPNVGGPPISDPKTLQDSLSAIGNNGTFRGGTVNNNSANKAPNGGAVAAATTPEYSYTATVAVGHTAPATLAAYANVPLYNTNLGGVNLAAGGTLTFNLSNVSAASALISIDWGDGSPYSDQNTAVSHIYSTIGTYDGSLVTMDNGALQTFDFAANIGSSGQTLASFNETITAYAPIVQSYATGTAPLAIDPVPEPAAIDPVPEPAALVTLALGLGGLAMLRRRVRA